MEKVEGDSCPVSSVGQAAMALEMTASGIMRASKQHFPRFFGCFVSRIDLGPRFAWRSKNSPEMEVLSS